MALSFQYDKRVLVPHWRKFSDTLKSNELNTGGEKVNPTIDLTKTLIDWQSKKDFITASEVVNGALTTHRFDFPELYDAKLLLETSSNSAQSISLALLHNSLKLEGDVISANNTSVNNGLDLLLEDIQVENIQTVWDRINSKSVNINLGILRKMSKDQMLNPIVWVEMSRLYLTQGILKKAMRSMKVALSIAPDNKYVLRAATSLFVNLDESERAIFYLRKSLRTKFDPWLISAHMAASRTINRYSPFIKNGRVIISDKNSSIASLTELASSIGTEDYIESGLKKANSSFEIALKNPNDNTLAQIEWLSQRDNKFSFNPLRFKKLISHPYEAHALDALENGKWEEAFINGAKWFFETPYNIQSVKLCIFLLDLLFQKHNEAIEFCKSGLRIHPNDDSLLNNHVYLHVRANRQDEVRPYINRMLGADPSKLSIENQIAYAATMGLLAFRSGKSDDGIELYNTSIQYANRVKSSDIACIATMNLTREVFKAKLNNKFEYLKRLRGSSDLADSAAIRFAAKQLISQLSKVEI